MLVAISLLVLAGDSVGKLSGDNICREEQRSTVNVTQYFLRNSTVRNYEWCLNVPPRCSFYTTRLVNDSRVVEKEVTLFVDKCCSGFVEDPNGNRCLPACLDCRNGRCVDGKCLCHLGYKGENCTNRCDATEWGENCKFQCDCEGSGCDPASGECLCSEGYTGPKCQFPCSPGFHGQNCRFHCNCPSGFCDSITGNCQSPSTINPLPTKIHFTNNGKLEIVTTQTSQPTSDLTPTMNEKSFDFGSSSTGKPAPMMKYGPEVTKNEFTIRSDRNDDNTEKQLEKNKSDLVNSASAATAISAGIILVAGVIVAVNHFKKAKEKEVAKRGKEVSTVAVYTHSIFHTPLPDPPPFENPIFASPVESNQKDGLFETHVVCSMNFPGHSIGKDNSREFLYDHPPSTGSYRAASIPEPPYTEGVPHTEPLYDEIPSGMVPKPVSEPPPSYQAVSLYMNTAKTKF